MKKLVSMREALARPDLLAGALPGDSWRSWRTLLIAAMGEPLTDVEREAFQRLTGRQQEPLQRVEELWGVIGRRGGKTRAAAALAVYIGALCDHSANLSAGERGLVLCLAQNVRTAQVAFGYASGIFETQPLLAGLVTGRTVDTLSLSTGIDLEIRPASFRGLRGVTAVAVIADEAAFWYTDETSANADSEILNAVRPALATTNGPLIVISSPYARRGEVYGAWRRHFGPAGDPLILVAQGASRDFNSSLPQRIVDRAMERDPAAASAEYLGLFRSDIEAFLSREAVEACVSRGVLERPPLSSLTYMAFTDPSGGSNDSFTLAVVHREGDCAVLDAVRERRPPFSPEGVVAEFCDLLARYRVRAVRGDRYAGQWPVEQFRKYGVAYLPSERDRSSIYTDLLPAINSRRVDLLDHARLVSQLVSLERKTGRARDFIDAPPGLHEDVANAVAGAIVSVIGRKGVSLSGPNLLVIRGGADGGDGADPSLGSYAWQEFDDLVRRRGSHG